MILVQVAAFDFVQKLLDGNTKNFGLHMVYKKKNKVSKTYYTSLNLLNNF